MRTAPSEMLQDLFDRFDSKQKMVLEHLVGNELDGAQWSQAQLPIKLGGCGIRGAATLADASYLMSRALTLTSCKRVDRKYITSGDVEDRIFCGVGAAVEHVNRQLPPEKQFGNQATNEEGIDDGPAEEGIGMADVERKSLILSRWVEANRLFEDAGTWDKARFNAVQAFPAGHFLSGVPSFSGGTRLTGEEFRSRVGRRLGVKLREATPCPMCHQMLDEYGARAEGCMCGVDAVLRHNQNNFIMYKQAKTAGTNLELEKSKLLSNGQSGQLGRKRPADTLLNFGART